MNTYTNRTVPYAFKHSGCSVAVLAVGGTLLLVSVRALQRTRTVVVELTQHCEQTRAAVLVNHHWKCIA
jgi:hypothetical protein